MILNKIEYFLNFRKPKLTLEHSNEFSCVMIDSAKDKELNAEFYKLMTNTYYESSDVIDFLIMNYFTNSLIIQKIDPPELSHIGKLPHKDDASMSPTALKWLVQGLHNRIVCEFNLSTKKLEELLNTRIKFHGNLVGSEEKRVYSAKVLFENLTGLHSEVYNLDKKKWDRCVSYPINVKPPCCVLVG